MPQCNQIDEYKLHFKNPPIIVSRRWFCQLPFEWQTRLFPFELVEILITGFTVLIDSFLRFVPRFVLIKATIPVAHVTAHVTNHLHNSHNRRFPPVVNDSARVCDFYLRSGYRLQEPRVCQGCTVNGAIFTLDDDNDDGSSRQRSLSSLEERPSKFEFFFFFLIKVKVEQRSFQED